MPGSGVNDYGRAPSAPRGEPQRIDTMEGPELRRHVRTMHELVGSGESDMGRRDDADAAFRRSYQTLREEWDGIHPGVSDPVKHAFLSLVGNDDWSTARSWLERALERLD